MGTFLKILGIMLVIACIGFFCLLLGEIHILLGIGAAAFFILLIFNLFNDI